MQSLAAASLVLPLLNAPSATAAGARVPPPSFVEPAGVPPQADAASVEDPGRRERSGGIAIMTLGGLGLVANAAVAIRFGLQARDGQRELDAQQAFVDAQGGPNCAIDLCPDATAAQAEIRRDRRTAALAGGVGGAISASVLIVGALVYRRGATKSESWARKHAIVVAPASRGLALSGRF